MPGLQEENSLVPMEQPKGTRKSKRQKEPSSKWNDDSSFLVGPPKLSKKNVVRGGNGEGTSSKPLLISDWSNAQILINCNAYGITFTESDSYLNDCITYIHMLETSKSVPSRGRQDPLWRPVRTNYF